MNNIKKAREIIKESDALLITAGAGMGVDSGLPDFRGDEGFWKAYPPIAKLGISFSSMANPRWFEDDPHFAWGFYGHRLNLYRNTTPHEGFKILKTLGESKKGGYFVFTSNVDGQFQKAGFDDKKIVEVHGSIHHMQCINDCQDEIWDPKEEIEVDMEELRSDYVPTCPHCGKTARSNILMFGDWGWNSSREDKQERNFQIWLESIIANSYKLAIVEVGAGEAVPTIRMLSESVAGKLNANVIRINPRDDYIDPNLGVSIALGGLEGIKRVL